MIIVTDLSHPFLTDFVFIREGFLFFFCNGLYLRRDSSFFSPDYVDSQRDLFLPRTSPKEKNGTAAYFTHHVQASVAHEPGTKPIHVLLILPTSLCSLTAFSCRQISIVFKIKTYSQAIIPELYYIQTFDIMLDLFGTHFFSNICLILAKRLTISPFVPLRV